MLSSILKKSTCANCKFCCSFRRQSLWETPVFNEEAMHELKKLFPSVKFRKAGDSNQSYTFDISEEYKTQDSEEEVPCPFLNPKNGCSLSAELKPFDCKIWPLRAVKESENSSISIALSPTCPAINKLPLNQIKDLLDSGLGKQIILYAHENPDILKEKTIFLSNIIYS